MRDPTTTAIDTSIHDRPIDFGKTAADYARHRQGFPPRFSARYPDPVAVPHRVFAIFASYDARAA
jgi:hypothetical protein